MRRQIYWQVVMKYFLPKSNILCMIQIYLYSLKIKINTSVCGMAIGSFPVCLHNEETIKHGESFLHSGNSGWWSQGVGRGHCKAKVKSVIFCGLSVQFGFIDTICKSLKLCFWGKGKQELAYVAGVSIGTNNSCILKVCISSYGNRAYRYLHISAQSILKDIACSTFVIA